MGSQFSDAHCDGIWGIAPANQSKIQDAYRAANSGSSAGDTLVQRIFDENPSVPDYLSFFLGRTVDAARGKTVGEFTVGKYLVEYPYIGNTTVIPLVQSSVALSSNVQPWSLELNGLAVNGHKLNLATETSGLAAGSAVALLALGESWIIGPDDAVAEIMSNVEGAVFSAGTGDESLYAGTYAVPCTSLIDVLISVGPHTFPLTPIDLNVNASISTDGTGPQCTAGIYPVSSQYTGGLGADWIFGDAMLKSVYSLYNYGTYDNSTGSSTGGAFLQMVPTTDITVAISNFNADRGTTYSTTSANAGVL